MKESPPPDSFDVFLSHNSRDKPIVRRIAAELRNGYGLRVWVDEDDLIPGRRWIPALEEIIETTRSAAVLVGPHGLGPWERPEMEACLMECVSRGLPVIPVVLPETPDDSKIPFFLRSFTWVDLREGITPEGLDRLVWGITGKKPNRGEPADDRQRPGGPRLHNLPFLSLGPLFKGREPELIDLAAGLEREGAAAAIVQHQTLWGLGGIGKTRLAVEYGWRFGNRYTAVLFVRADSPESLRSGIAGLAGILGLPAQATAAEEAKEAAVLAWLRENRGCLLILDNVDTPEAARAVRDLLPRLDGSHALVTSRLRDWPAAIRKREIETLTEDEAVRFLLERTEGERTPEGDDPEQARRLAEVLGGLPLALEQAAAYVAHHQASFRGYLESWERERESVLEWYRDTMDYPYSVAVTWQQTFRQLGPTARAVLRLEAQLAPEPIAESMFVEGSWIVEEAVACLRKETGESVPVRQRLMRWFWLRRARDAAKAVQPAFAELAAYSMVTRKPGTFTVHRVVQEVLRTRIPEERRREWVHLALRLVNAFSPFESDDVRTWPVWDPLRPHVARIVEEADRQGITEPTGRLMNDLGVLLLNKGLYSEAEPLMHRALEIDRSAFGEEHPAVARDLNNLAQLLQDTNRLGEAEPLMRRALEIDRAAFGEKHPRIAVQLNNLATLLLATNRLGEAELLMRRALDIDRSAFGEEHPKVALRLNNLATLLPATNRPGEAELLMRRALDINRSAFGEEHPRIAVQLNNLAQLLKNTNRLGEAEPLMRRALEIDRSAFGEEHPYVAIRLNNLARLLQATNRLDEAEPLMRKALEIFERSLGPDHPNTQITRRNLETSPGGQGRPRWATACPFSERIAG